MPIFKGNKGTGTIPCSLEKKIGIFPSSTFPIMDKTLIQPQIVGRVTSLSFFGTGGKDLQAS